MSVIKSAYNVADKWLVFGLFIFISSFYLVPLGKVTNNLFYVLVLIPGLIVLYVERQKVVIGPELLAIFVFFGYTALSSAWSDGDGFLELIKRMKHVLYIVTLMLIISRELAHKERKIAPFLEALVMVAVISAVFNATFWYQDHSMNQRMWGTTGIWECIGLGISYALAAIVSMYQVSQSKGKYKKSFMFFCSVILMVAVLLTQSRLALGCLIGGVAALAFYFNAKRAWLLVLVGACLVGMVLIIEPAIMGRHLRLIHQLFGENGPLPARFYIWMNLMANMDGFWLFGHGMGETLDNNVPELPGQIYSTAHNLYIGQLYLTGIVGLLLLCNFIFQAFICSLREVDPKRAGLALSLVVFASICMIGQYTLLLDHPREVWINVLIPLAVGYGGRMWREGTSKKLETG